MSEKVFIEANLGSIKFMMNEQIQDSVWIDAAYLKAWLAGQYGNSTYTIKMRERRKYWLFGPIVQVIRVVSYGTLVYDSKVVKKQIPKPRIDY